jgi:5-enolpyruvylshikimate-3-phosphate synthase
MPPLLILLLILGFTAANVAATIYLTGVVQMKLSEVAPRLAAVADKLDKVKIEVQKLKDVVLGDPDVSQEVVDQFARVEQTLGAVDDINEDA